MRSFAETIINIPTVANTATTGISNFIIFAREK